jgi:hypothetical protein
MKVVTSNKYLIGSTKMISLQPVEKCLHHQSSGQSTPRRKEVSNGFQGRSIQSLPTSGFKLVDKSSSNPNDVFLFGSDLSQSIF